MVVDRITAAGSYRSRVNVNTVFTVSSLGNVLVSLLIVASGELLVLSVLHYKKGRRPSHPSCDYLGADRAGGKMYSII